MADTEPELPVAEVAPRKSQGERTLLMGPTDRAAPASREGNPDAGRTQLLFSTEGPQGSKVLEEAAVEAKAEKSPAGGSNVVLATKAEALPDPGRRAIPAAVPVPLPATAPSKPKVPAIPRKGSSTTAAPAQQAVQIRMAGFWRRALASIVDLVLVFGFVLLVLWIGIGKLSLSTLPASPLWGIDYAVHVLINHPDRAWPIILFAGSTLFGYLFLSQAILGSTAGKLLLNMRIVGPDGRRIGPIRAFFRTVAYGISVGFFMMGFLWAAFDLERRALHDVLVGAFVIVGKPGEAVSPASKVHVKKRARAV